MQDSDTQLVDAIADANPEAAPIPSHEKALLQFAKRLTLQPAEISDADIDNLRRVGWQDPQIAEAVYIISLFAFFNRVADAFGLTDPGYRKKKAPPRS
ncbi:MAG: carboxymuconolactone decarboxylase family protein [Candidatus Zixiibacteriota bacterium]